MHNPSVLIIVKHLILSEKQLYKIIHVSRIDCYYDMIKIKKGF